MRALDDMKIRAKRVEVLTALRANRENHARIVTEARAGYLERAMRELQGRMDKIKAGRLVALNLHLALPVDQTNVYDTAIKMMELHQGDEVELNAMQVRNLIRDDWEWTKMFIDTNSEYSGTARSRSEEGDK